MECLMNRLLVFPLACALLPTMACGKIDLPTSPTNISAACELTLNPPAMAAPPTGGSFYTGVAGPCDWNAESADSWISVTYGKGTGVGTVTYNVAENAGATAREGHVRIGGQVLRVTQAGVDCSVAVEPTMTVPVAGGTFDIKIATNPQCAWTTSTSEPWLVLATSSGKGPQTLSLRVSENTSASERNAQIRVAEQTIAVRQAAAAAPPRPVPPAPPTTPAPPAPPTMPAPPAQPCTYTLTPASLNVSANGGSFQATVTAPGKCEWSAITSETWMSLGARGGFGTGQLTYDIQSNSGSERTGILQIAGQALRVTQAAGCSYTVDPTSQGVTSKGGEFTIAVTTGADCKWSASSTVSWISIRSGSGAGNGRVSYGINANDGAKRDGQIRIGQSSVSISQDGIERTADVCSLSLSPSAQKIPVEGGVFAIKVAINSECKWSVEKAPSWITFRSRSGTGPAEVVYAVEKFDVARTDVIVINGQTVSVSQGLR
jgi:hypothetical protein